MSDTQSCPACGTQLTGMARAEGFCPACEMGVSSEEVRSPAHPAEADEGPATLDYPGGFLSPGGILGKRYRIRSRLGSGGMGEVWRAFDLKLRVDVAVKALRDELLDHGRAAETLRQEVRVAREVISPNVCRVFDLLEVDGRELVSMEYIDGTTLTEILGSRSPLELEEAREIALQFLAGLEAIHQAGLVHRDIKPENVMITRSGRVVVMDFGIAKGLAAAATGTMAGTPAYMAPEQERGEQVDARADVYSAGVLLAEMVAPEGVRELEARQAVWRGVRDEPPRLPESPWQAVLEQAVSRSVEQRFASAAELSRALEEVALREEGAEDVTPYPGLAAFGEEDAGYFFGRELEVEEMWKKLRRPHLLGLIGQSGAGKSSFLRAGLLASQPPRWGHVVCTPGSAPFGALREALVPEVSGDTDAMRELVRGDDLDSLVSAVSRWRQRHKQALIILDQFEELFTLNPEEVQSRFSELLGRLVLDADVHVLLSMRDDFLFHCSDQPALAPIFSELTLLRSPTGSALRRALVQPALKCGYRFEDEGLVNEMVAEVSEERGALPLVAFAAAALWDRRDREAGLLTRRAYEEIGGVGGALAQHAEATLERIGPDRATPVRELFRNLVTAQGTRAARNRGELLSVFEEEEREAAAEILDALVDARLLMSYELSAEEGEEQQSHHRLEIIHESLLSAWPRLVRWQTQDADGAQLRDQLRQAAQTWRERDRSDDLLWTGTAFREYQLWRERYPGALTAVEEYYARAMADRAGFRQRRRRLALAAVLALLVAVVGVVGALWRQSEQARGETEVVLLGVQAAKLRADALLALQQTQKATALIPALASLELVDDQDTRLVALEALWRGSAASVIDRLPCQQVEFSPDGLWLASGTRDGIDVWPEDGGEARRLGGPEDELRRIGFAGESGLLAATCLSHGSIHLWSIPDGELLRSLDLEGTFDWSPSKDGTKLLTVSESSDALLARSWPLDEGEPTLLGRFEKSRGWFVFPGWFMYVEGGSVFGQPLDAAAPSPARLLGWHENEVSRLLLSPDGRRLASVDLSGEIRLWSLTSRPESPQRILRGHLGRMTGLAFDASGERLASSSTDGTSRIWDLRGPPGADPMVLSVGIHQNNDVAFHPDGGWLATARASGLAIWPLDHPVGRVLRGHDDEVAGLAFSPDGRWIYSSSRDGTIRQWPLSEEVGVASRVLFQGPSALSDLDIDPGGRFLLAGVGGDGGGTYLVPLVEGEPRRLEGFESQAMYVALSPDGRFAAAGGGQSDPREAVIRIWDLETEAVRVFDPGDGRSIGHLHFTPEGRLVSGGLGGVRIWNPDGTFETLRLGEEGEEPIFYTSLTPDGRWLASSGPKPTGAFPWDYLPLIRDLHQGGPWEATYHGHTHDLALDWTGTTLVTTGDSGRLRVGPVKGRDHHVLFGHDGKVNDISVSRDGRWIASAGTDATLRLWPMPKGEPLHTLPYEDLLGRLRALTNVRQVPQEGSQTLYRYEIEPFPGWEILPAW